MLLSFYTLHLIPSSAVQCIAVPCCAVDESWQLREKTILRNAENGTRGCWVQSENAIQCVMRPPSPWLQTFMARGQFWNGLRPSRILGKMWAIFELLALGSLLKLWLAELEDPKSIPTLSKCYSATSGRQRLRTSRSKIVWCQHTQI